MPLGAAEVSSTITVEAIWTTNAGGRGDATVEQPTIQLRITNVTSDGEGNVLSSEEDPRIAREVNWLPASVTNLSPALTPNWDCHQQAWLEG